MELENEKKQEGMSAEQTGNREGYQSTGNYQNYRAAGRSPRPRISNAQRSYNPERANYNKNKEDEGGFRPEGFGAALQGGAPQRPSYRPRYNNAGGYGQQQGGYGQQRGGYGQQRGGYGQQRGGYGQQQGGYRQQQCSPQQAERTKICISTRWNLDRGSENSEGPEV